MIKAQTNSVAKIKLANNKESYEQENELKVPLNKGDVYELTI